MADSTVDDIAALKRALQEAERRLQRVAAAGGPAMGTLEFALGADGQLLFVGADAGAARMITVARPPFFGRPLAEVFTGMAGTALPAALLATARDGAPFEQCEFVPPGTRLARAFSLFAFQTGPGHVVVKCWESVSEADRHSIASRNHELLSGIFGESPVAITLGRASDAVIVDVNDEWSRLTGIARERALGRTALQLGLWADAAARERMLDRLHGQGRVRDVPLSFDTPDGRHIDVSMHSALIDVAGVPHQLTYLLDVTERERARADLQALNARLELRVAERTAELAKARDTAERASRSKSDFLSSMSHELRTPMNAILGFAQLLMAEPAAALAPAQRGFVRQILRAGAHLLELINEVLDLARIEAGKLQISMEPVDLAALVDDALQLMRPVAADYGVDLVAAAPAGCRCHVLADRTRSRQVLLNLLSNAIKYNREKGRVWIDCAVEADAVRVGVSDTGRGLSEQQQQRLFRDFERLDADAAPIEGSGIGLALSRRLMTLMGGSIGVDSEVGRGSTFWLRLRPAPAGSAPAAPPARAAADDAAGAAQPRRKLLYVEDNPVNVSLMEALLMQRPQLRLIVAPLPGIGLDLARAERPDLVLLDIQLPGMDGYELLRRLRQSEATARVPVIAISANAMPADVSRGLEAGFARYLTKPIDVTRVLAAIDEVLAG